MDVARNLQVKDLSRKETDEEEYRKGVDSKQDIMNTFVDEARSVSSTLDELVATPIFLVIQEEFIEAPKVET